MYRVRDANWNSSKYIRAGIIPYVEQNGIRFYGFSIDNEIAQLGDFGGHREIIDRDVLDTAIREYEEESLNLFGVLNRDDLQDCVILDGVDTIEILVPVSGFFYQYTNRFRQMITGDTRHEAQNVVWLTRKQVLKIIDGQHTAVASTKIYQMYDRIRDVLHRNRDQL
jgi:hypothetical protein